MDELTEKMTGRGYRAEALHGGMDQAQRDRVMARLRDGTAELLIATDVAARGLDIDTLSHVFNYEVPSAPESYVHRIGRVGRAGREGIAITLAEPRQRRLLKNIEKLTRQTIDVRTVASVADLRARQVESTVAAIREALAADDLEDFSAVMHDLADEASDRAVALAAIKLVHEGRGAVLDEVEIPAASARVAPLGKSLRGDRDGPGGRRPGRPGHGPAGGPGPRARRSGSGPGFVHIGLGRNAGVRPGDLVGVIAHEAGLSGKDIGPIRISDNYSVVGIPAGSVDEVILAIGSAKLRGKRISVRRYVA